MRLIPAALLVAVPFLHAIEIVRPGVHQTEDGAYAGTDTPFVPGETVFFSSQFSNFQTSKKRVSIEYKVEALDASDTPLIEAITAKVDVELHDEDKDWKPKVRQQILIPPHAPGGIYRVRVVAMDKLAKSTAVKEVEFHVRGPKLEPAAAITVQHLSFYRSEEDPRPMTISAYRPGETLWARFNIAGFSSAEGNAVDVEYSVSVATAAGKLLFRQTEPTAEQGASFYPKRIVPCLINLSLQNGIATGDYVVTVSARDKVAGKTAEASATFSVEK